VLSGWIPAEDVAVFQKDMESLTAGRVALLAFDPYERPEIQEGREKVPIAFKHNKLSKSFEPLVFSYGAPLYGTLDPTPITAFFFTLLFAVMFGDVGQGAGLVLLGFLAANKKIRFFDSYRNFAGTLKMVGAASMFTGLLYGGVFSNETLLEGPTAAFTGALASTGFGQALGIQETEKIITLMPETGSIGKLFYFFGFTIAIGVILNSVGLILNVMNHLAMRRYEKAVFSRNGIAGIAFFWYAVSIAVRAIIANANKSAFSIHKYDIICLLVPVFFIATGTFWARLIGGKRPLFEEGFFAFVMEGIVEILETVSGYISNTVSFLRVGAFALSHAVLSFIIFTMADKISSAAMGQVWAFIVIVFGNVVIILLEGMIVAIQVVRLHYYEFYGKFFNETGTTFTPFRFRKTREE
jgi:V/A-type H+-transporting ATPase subunit I